MNSLIPILFAGLARKGPHKNWEGFSNVFFQFFLVRSLFVGGNKNRLQLTNVTC